MDFVDRIPTSAPGSSGAPRVDIDHRVCCRELVSNPSIQDLRDLARKDETTTCYGSACYVTNVRNRSARLTYVVSGQAFTGIKQRVIDCTIAARIVGDVQRYISGRRIIQLSEVGGESSAWRMTNAEMA